MMRHVAVVFDPMGAVSTFLHKLDEQAGDSDNPARWRAILLTKFLWHRPQKDYIC